MISKFLNGNEENSLRSGQIWNMISSLCFSFQSFVFMFIVTRAGGLNEAGMFSITYSVAQMFSSIGNFSMRDYQVSDTNNKYSFSQYFTSRIISESVMIIVSTIYVLLNGFNGEKLGAVLLFLLYRMIDGFDDVIHGQIQKEGRLDISAKIFAGRIVCASVGFIIVYLFTKKLIISAIMLLLVSVTISAVLNGMMIRERCISVAFHTKGTLKLLIECVPVCAGAFLYNYLVNSPKYAIDAILSNELQTIFNILFMPVFIINMLGMFIYKPYVLKIGKLWNDGQIRDFVRMSLKMLAALLVIVAGVLVIGYLIGVPILGFVYGINLSEYKMMFVLLLAFGGITAINTLGTMLITVMRKQLFIIIAYCVAFVLDVAFMNGIVEKNGLVGASQMYGIVMTIILTMYVGIIISVVYIASKKENKNELN